MYRWTAEAGTEQWLKPAGDTGSTPFAGQEPGANGLAFDDPGRELDFQGVYRLAPNGELHLMLDTLRAANGIALSPDERIPYVSDVGPAHRPCGHLIWIRIITPGRVVWCSGPRPGRGSSRRSGRYRGESNG